MLSEPSDNAQVVGAPVRIFGFLRLVLVVSWTILWICLAFVAVIVTFRSSSALVAARRFWGPSLLWLAGVELAVAPHPRIDWTKPHVFVMNHQSIMDIPVAFTCLPVNLHFVAKHSLKHVPFLGWYMWLTGMVFVDRTNRQQAVDNLGQAARRIRDGANIIVYPEGTRSKDGRLMPFKRGAFVLALQAQIPVVPVAIVGSRDVIPSGGSWIRPGRIRVKVGEPIPTEGRLMDERAQFAAEVEEQVRALMQELTTGR